MRPYEMADGTEVSGFRASVMRALDAMDPLDPSRPRVYADGTTRAEMLRCMGEARWCDSIGAAVVPDCRDMFSLEGDEWLQRRIEEFLSARLAWALDQRARHPGHEKEIDPYVKFCQRQDTAAKARDMKASFKAHRRIDVSELDREPSLLGTPLGVLDLDTGLMPGEEAEEEAVWCDIEPDYAARMFRITRRTEADMGSDVRRVERRYDARWDSFVAEVMDGDAERAAFLKRALGYSLYGGNPEKATFVLWGPKRDNGKSTLMNVVKRALGDYAASAPAGLLLDCGRESYTAANPVLASLVGKRLVDVSEPPLGAALDCAMVKKLASGTDEISTRHLHRDEFSYVPQFTIWMHCNALPVVGDTTAVDPRHMFVVEFPRSFEGAERDTGLADRFATPDGMHTVLVWLAEGYRDYREQGLNPPACVTEATEQWLKSSGTWLDSFLRDRCVLGADEKCLVSDFKEAAFAYAEGLCEDKMTMREMNRYLRQLSIAPRPVHGKRWYYGVGLCETEAEAVVRDAENVLRSAGGTPSGGNPTITLI
ncbi:phage/plasmid primase, P4 family [Adlercreutzia sp. R25]|uniref:DNA primase family protein n=1 Tax=Adlercreutzia shanghongiae TaxID=3111773 RepID=UPI002DC03B4F|nr:phage/plasmid primase, P4 family [Adlercreutzia sp. R25]MEC4272943.1 phage/plasmid primase, P4 family [Adlercreutzia sp. R25]